MQEPTTMDERRLGEGGRYELRTRLGAGAIGIVTLAYDNRMMRFVAVKELSPTFARNPKIRARFRNEALIQGDIVHENVVRALDVLEEGDTLAIVMDFIDGTDVDGLLEQAGGRLDWEVARSLMPPIFGGVAAAHRKGIVHRDLKPGNILIDRSSGSDVPRVTDFGIAKIVGSAEGLTREGAVMGTPAYMSPEQLKGVADLDARTDIYALGAIVYRLLCGGPPHAGTSEYDITHKVLSQMPVSPPSSLVPGLPVGLDGWVAKAMAFDRNERFESVEAMAAAFSTVETVSRQPALFQPSARWAPTSGGSREHRDAAPGPSAKRHPNAKWIAAAIVLLGVGGLLAWRFNGVTAPAATTPVTVPVSTVISTPTEVATSEAAASTAPAQPIAAPPTPPVPAKVAITIHPNVGGILLQVAGQDVAYPLPDSGEDKVITFDYSTAALVVTARKPGFKAGTFSVTPNQSGQLDVVLEAEPPPTVAAAQAVYVAPPEPTPSPNVLVPGTTDWRFTTVVMGSRAGNGLGVNGFYEMDVADDFSSVTVRKIGFSNGQRRISINQVGVGVPTLLGSVAGQPAYGVDLKLSGGPAMWFVFLESTSTSIHGFWRQTGAQWESVGFYGILEGRPRTDFERQLSRNDPRVCFQDCAVNGGMRREDMAALGRTCVAQCGP